MLNLLVNAPSGRQEIVKVEQSGSYFDASRVLWDERTDGPLPEITLGGMVRAGDELVLDPQILASNNAVINNAAKADKWLEIKDERDRRKGGGVKITVGGVDKWFHSDDASRIQQIGLVLMGANIPVGLQWKTMDGTFATMTQALAGQIFNAVATLDQTAFANAETHRLAMEASQTPAAYDFSSGWPEVFGE